MNAIAHLLFKNRNEMPVHRHAKKEKRPLCAGTARTEMNAFAHGRILHAFGHFVKGVRVEKCAILQEQIMQIANKRG